ncbi:E3 ubiquitin-protein ligase TRIM11-like [Leptodactylus fuscus]
MASADLADKLLCSICLKFCEDPIRLICGHSFCRGCIDMLDTLEGSGEDTCPECREESGEQAVRAEKQPSCEGRGIFCTDCTFSPLPAVISCLYCEASLCDHHLRVHGKSEEHVLTKLNFTCSTHKKSFSYYCSEDAACLCITCSLSEEHQGHRLETLAQASDKKKEELRNVLENLDKNKKATEERIENLQEHLRGAKEKASGVTEKVVALFTDTRRQLDVLEDKILKDISDQEEKARDSVLDLIHVLEVKIAQLTRDMKAMEEICAMTEPLSVLQSSKSVNGDLEVVLEELRSDPDVGLISATLHTALSDLITSVRRGFFVQQTPDIILNVDTASNDIHITSDLKSVSGSEFKQNRPKLPERFQYNQVLSTRSFSSGRHFLEVETCHSGNWRLGMAYASIARKGYHSLIGQSNKSWGLCRYLNQYFVVHDRKVVPVLHKPSSQRLGIFLDYEAGHIGFYELCDPIRHLYTYAAKFNEALYLILGVYTGWVRIRN